MNGPSTRASGDGPGSAPEPATLSVRQLLVRTVVGLAAIMAGLASISYLLRKPLQAMSERFVEVLHGPGVALGYFLPDALTLPIPNDAFGFFGIVGGMGFWEVVAWGGCGSVAGGVAGYGIGRQLRRTEWLQRFMARHGNEAQEAVRRYGAAALATAALLPIPYSVACWTAGAVSMRFSRFLAVSLLRIVRVGLYLWLIELGVVEPLFGRVA